MDIFFSADLSNAASVYLCSPHCSPFWRSRNELRKLIVLILVIDVYFYCLKQGFQDALCFYNLLEKYGEGKLDYVMELYSSQRVPEGEAVCDLSVRMYLSLRSSTSDTWSNRLVESSNRFLNKIWPTMWPHEVDSVVFTQKPYRDCLAEVCRQKLLATHLRRATYFAVVAIAFEIGKYFGSCPQN